MCFDGLTINGAYTDLSTELDLRTPFSVFNVALQNLSAYMVKRVIIESIVGGSACFSTGAKISSRKNAIGLTEIIEENYLGGWKYE
jgi:hypothetical protein